MSTLPRLHSHPNPYAATAYPASTTSSQYGGQSSSYGAYSTPRRDSYGYPTSTRGGGSAGGVPRILKRLFKFPQMDFEVAIWEMTHLMVAPRKVFRNLYYQRQTKTHPTSSDPALPYLTLLFQLLAALAWSLAYSPRHTLRILSSFLLLQCALFTLLLATLSYLALPKLFGPNGLLRDFSLGGRTLLGRKRRGLFREAAAGESGGEVTFGYAFDVAVRTYIPLLVYLSLLQFLLMPIVATPSSHTHLSATASNILHAAAFTHALYVTFLGYSALPSLQNTQVLLVPGVAVVWGVALALSIGGVGMTGRRGAVGWVPGLGGVMGGEVKLPELPVVPPVVEGAPGRMMF